MEHDLLRGPVHETEQRDGVAWTMNGQTEVVMNLCGCVCAGEGRLSQ